jgi:hypothetical protein
LSSTMKNTSYRYAQTFLSAFSSFDILVCLHHILILHLFRHHYHIDRHDNIDHSSLSASDRTLILSYLNSQSILYLLHLNHNLVAVLSAQLKKNLQFIHDLLLFWHSEKGNVLLEQIIYWWWDNDKLIYS